MAHIKLNGKEYALHFKNREVAELEERTGKSMETYFGEDMASGKITPMYTLLLVMLKRHEEFEHMTKDEFMDFLDDEMENGLEFQTIGNTLTQAVENSVFMKQAQAKQTAPKAPKKPKLAASQ